ncbi:pilus assembly protein PilP, partial [Thermodesulfobacteriota bacterium]
QKDLDRAERDADYRYNPIGKVDPFQPYFLEAERGIGGEGGIAGAPGGDSALEARMQKMLEKLREPKTELQRFSLSELTVTAVVKTKTGVTAMVVDPEGRGYVLKKGTYIGKMGGIVDQIQCEEKKGAFGNESVRKIIIKEPFFNRDRKLDYKYKEMELPFKGTYK